MNVIALCQRWQDELGGFVFIDYLLDVMDGVVAGLKRHPRSYFSFAAHSSQTDQPGPTSRYPKPS